MLLAAILLPDLSRAQPFKPEEIYRRVLPSVMTLHVATVRGENYIGTAFLTLDKNVAVTAWHVVSDATKVTAKFSDDHVVNVDRLIDKDEEHDLALIHLDGAGRPEAPLCFTDPPIGSRVYAIGAPKGFDFSLTDGLISQIQKIHGSAEYQVSCPISGGNSGGPVVNDRGEVLGIVAWTQKDAQNLSFAIPAGFLTHLNPKHATSPWNDPLSPGIQPPLSPRDSANTSEPQRTVSELKNLLRALEGEHVTISVSTGGNERKFELVLPKDFAN